MTTKKKAPKKGRPAKGPKTMPSDFHPKSGLAGAAKESKEKGLPERLKKFAWKPGQSGNPNGRPKHKILSKAYKHMLAQIEPDSGMTYAELIALGQITSAIYKGNTAAAKEIADRTEGQSLKTIKLESEGELTLRAASDEELDEIIAGAAREIAEAKKNAPKPKDEETNDDATHV